MVSTGLFVSDGDALQQLAQKGLRFSSATDSQMMVLLARTPGGVSLFYAPMRRTIQKASHRESELNGIAIQRMKNKLGTRALPTAELELKGMRAWLVGEEGRGTKQVISTLLSSLVRRRS